jgi:AraC family transcriptional regulator
MPRVLDDITLGRRVQTWSLAGLAVHKVRYHGDGVMPRHAHRHANLTFVLGGAIEETTAAGTRCLHGCDAVIKPAGMMHSNQCGPRGLRSIVVEFGKDGTGLDGTGESSPTSYATLSGPDVARAAFRIASAVETADARAEVVETVIEILSHAAECRDPRPPANGPAELARRLLHDGYAQPLRVQDLAATVEVHPVYIARAFRRAFGTSITAYRRKLQVQDAARRLCGDEPLAAVALRSGFSDQSHLCRVFAEAFKVSPGEFRRVIRN